MWHSGQNTNEIVPAANNGNKSDYNPTSYLKHHTSSKHSLNHGLKKLEASKFTMSDVESMTNDFANLINNDIVAVPLLIPAAAVLTPCRIASNITLVSNMLPETQV